MVRNVQRSPCKRQFMLYELCPMINPVGNTMKKPFFTAFLIGVLIFMVLYGIALVNVYNLSQDMLALILNTDLTLERPVPGEQLSPDGETGWAFNNFPQWILLQFLLVCAAWTLPGLLSGGLYAVWHSHNNPDGFNIFKGSALVGIYTHVTGNIILSTIGLFILLPFQKEFIAILATSNEEYTTLLPPISTSGYVLLGLFACIIGLGFWIAVGMLTGIVGGFLGRWWGRMR
jgi:hypothetical protein